MRLVGPNGEEEVYALLDDGSTTTLVDSALVGRLGIKGEVLKVKLRGVWGGATPTKCERIRVDVRGPYGDCGIEHAITAPLDLPAMSLSAAVAGIVYDATGIRLGPFEDTKPKVLIGQDNLRLIEARETRGIGDTGFTLTRTLLGWTVHGFIEDTPFVERGSNAYAGFFRD